VGASTQIWPERWPRGWHVQHVHETGSTNADLLARATEAPDRTVLAADHQTAGRGRLDRRWDAPPGANLLVSILFRHVPAAPGEFVRRVGLAATDAARELSGLDVGLKWPNDLVVDGAKLAGILAQRAPGGEVVVGLGLNVRWAPPGAVRLGDRLAPATVLAALLEAYDRLPSDITQRYRERLHTLGQWVRVELPDAEIVGRATDVEPDGRLVVLDECGITHRLDVGDIVHLRSADPAG
jgi:BirA family transcriptional regulator, biotin operon repressor / biotin---[acetyl-CoA-carboxylase] ligase